MGASIEATLASRAGGLHQSDGEYLAAGHPRQNWTARPHATLVGLATVQKAWPSRVRESVAQITGVRPESAARAHPDGIGSMADGGQKKPREQVHDPDAATASALPGRWR
jgi:hypothetical protein